MEFYDISRENKGYKKYLKIPKGGNQNPFIEEGQTTCNGQKKTDKRTNNYLQNIHVHIKLKIE
jgi:hypothetical protein